MMNKNQIETIESYNQSSKDFMDKIGSLKNYNETYDYLINLLNENDNVLDLACGPAQISRYLLDRINLNITGVDLSVEMLKIAKNNIPKGIFLNYSIVTFKPDISYNLIILGFGIPYLDKNQTIQYIKNCASMLIDNGYIYISFMDCDNEGFEKTSFGGENRFYIYYHKKENIKNILEDNGIEIIKEYTFDYNEKDGRITKDIVLIGKKPEIM